MITHRNRRKFSKGEGKWSRGITAMIDDHSGFQFYSDEMYVNDAGLVTTYANYDANTQYDQQPYYPEMDNSQGYWPIQRPKQPSYFLPSTPLAETWNQIDVAWNVWGTPWGESTRGDLLQDVPFGRYSYGDVRFMNDWEHATGVTVGPDDEEIEFV